MSVESQSGEQEGVVEQAGAQQPQNTHCQSSKISLSMEGLPKSTSTPQVAVTSNFTENESTLSGRNRARDWMEKLDSLQRTCALAFVDEPFLTALLSFASWSEGPSTSSGSTRRTGKHVDWTAIVDIDAFAKSLLGNLSERLSKSTTQTACGNGEDAAKTVCETKSTDGTSDRNENGMPVDSNALRIPKEDEVTEAGKFPLLDVSLLSSVFKDMCFAFPSAFRQFDYEYTDEKSPLVVVTHQFDETDWQHAFSAFDQAFTHLFGARFLNDVDLSQTSADSLLLSQMERLKAMNTPVTLGLIFLVRLEVAAIFSFKEVHGDSCDQNASGSRLRKKLPELLLNPTILRSDSQDDDCLGSFVSAFRIPKGVCVELDSVLLTPLSFLSFTNSNAHGLDWAVLDDAISVSLRKIVNSLPAREEPGILPSNEVESKEDQARSVAECTTSDSLFSSTTQQRKKKRKSRKRKGGKKNPTEKLSIETEDLNTEIEKTDADKSTEDAKFLLQNLIVPTSTGIDMANDEHQHPEITNVPPFAHSVTSVQSTDSEQGPSGGDSAEKGTPSEIVLGNTSPKQRSISLAGNDANNLAIEDDDEDAWETVEARGRGNRRKGPEQHGGASKNRSYSGGPDGASGSKKTKGARSVASRKKVANRKVAKDIISSILDKVDDEIQGKKPVIMKNADNPWKSSPSVQSTRIDARLQPHNSASKIAQPREMTLRDVLVGSKESAGSDRNPAEASHERNSVLKKDQKDGAKVLPKKADKGITSALADQNTAPTYQETVSAVSTPSNVATKDDRNHSEDRASKSDSSVDDTNEVPPNGCRIATQPEIDGSSDDPPLPTLLNPENANSATSSVASSLEVPNGCHRHHAGSGDVNDVGYHLLDVCDRLSRDMCLFMNRRALALGARRRERGAILFALQDMLSRIWPNSCHVEMYGSCATQLDLPSSDIDVVIMGLDRNQNLMMHASSPLTGASETPSSVSVNEASPSNASANDSSRTNETCHEIKVQQHQLLPFAPFMSLPIQTNGDRVRRLAAELEAQPWAVQVNAIPTASVPVVKVLCDPSRLVGGSNVGEWMVHHQHLTTKRAGHSGRDSTKDEEFRSAQHPSSPPQAMLPWRGSDVMNGLLKLDITFEGPEHGGIGSTQFSSRVVADACQRANVHPDATPLVQVVMVLKELLVQRKLNEPYSGGLSSYALLLLVVALLREREVIRKEIERVEFQRKAMTEGDATVAFANTGVRKEEQFSTSTWKGGSRTNNGKSSPQPSKRESIASRKARKDASLRTQAPSRPASSINELGPKNGHGTSEVVAVKGDAKKATKTTGLSSWASIAKKNPKQSSSQQQQSVGNKMEDSKSSATREPSSSAKATFADAVSRPVGTISAVAEKGGATDAKSRHNGFHLPSEDAARKAQLEAKHDNAPAKDSSAQFGSKKEEPRSKDQAQLKTETTSIDPSIIQGSSYFAQGFNDIVEVLCSGETTAGKLLMHFLLYYGEHFDAQTTAIDISGKHERSFSNNMLPYQHISPYIQRRAHGTIDPITGMLTVDPIVIFDPLEGAENTNVARRCFAWNSVRWIFAQSYNTLSSAVERSASPFPPSTKHIAENRGDHKDTKSKASSTVNSDVSNDPSDPSSPLLRCLLSF